MKETLKKQRSKIPAQSSFATLKTAVQDGLIVAQLQLFLNCNYYDAISSRNTPLVPFMTTEITVLLETLMQKFIKQSEMWAANSPAKIAKFNVLEIGIHLATADIAVGFAATVTLTKALKEKKLSQLQMYEFKKEYCTMLAAIVTKILESSPLKYNFARKLES